MTLRAVLLVALLSSVAGCGGGVPADAPKTPEAGDKSYESYRDAGRYGPGGGSGGGAHGGGSGSSSGSPGPSSGGHGGR